jgi:hypothetical protein
MRISFRADRTFFKIDAKVQTQTVTQYKKCNAVQYPIWIDMAHELIHDSGNNSGDIEEKINFVLDIGVCNVGKC